MPAVGETLQVEGLRDLQKAFRLAGRQSSKLMRETLRRVAEPVRADAERLAEQEISHIGIPWSRMRVGITLTTVYVAPKQRGRFTRRNPQRYARPNLAPLLLDKAMMPALQKNEELVHREFDAMLNGLGMDWERAA